MWKCIFLKLCNMWNCMLRTHRNKWKKLFLYTDDIWQLSINSQKTGISQYLSGMIAFNPYHQYYSPPTTTTTELQQEKQLLLSLPKAQIHNLPFTHTQTHNCLNLPPCFQYGYAVLLRTIPSLLQNISQVIENMDVIGCLEYDGLHRGRQAGKALTPVHTRSVLCSIIAFYRCFDATITCYV